MEYGLRRYEAFQGLATLLFLVLCLMLALPASTLYSIGGSYSPASDSPVSVGYQTLDFWLQQRWIDKGPMGSLIVYLAWAGLIFLIGRFVWLIAQYFGKHMADKLLTEAGSNAPKHSKPSLDTLLSKPERLFDADYVRLNADRAPHKYIFHSFQRLLLLLPKRQGNLSSEDLLDKERRVAETDWHLFHSSWSPFRWLLWILPLLALIQTGSLLYGRVRPLVSEGANSTETLNLALILVCLIPLVQVALFCIFLNFCRAIQQRLEGIYLSGLDALFYDRFLSRLPFQSGDTLILLEALQHYFDDVHTALKRLEEFVGMRGLSSSRENE